MVRATSTVTSPPSIVTARTMPRSTMLSPSSGSITARRPRAPRRRAGRDARRRPAVDGRTTRRSCGDSTCVAANSGPTAPGCPQPPGAGNMVRHVAPGAVGVGANEEEPVTTHGDVGQHRQEAGPVTLTDDATAKVAELLAQEEGEDLALRVAVKPGGCSGYSYEMFFDSEVMPDDVVPRVRHGQGRGRLGQRRAAHRLDPRLQRRAAGCRVPHHEPQRHPHLRLRLLLQLSPARPGSAP